MESVGHEDTKRPEEHEARTRGLHFRQTRGLGGYALAGAAFALAYLTRSEAIVFLVAGLGAVLLLRLTMGRPIPWQRTLAGTALALVIFCGLISPYLFVLHERTGKWQLLEEAGSTYVSAQGLAYGNTAAFDVATWGLDPASGEVYYFSTTSEGQGLIEAIIANPVEFGRRLRANLKELVSSLTGPQLLGWPLLSLALLGLFHQPWDARRLRGELLLAVSLAGPFSFVLFFVQDRYLATALIPALVWIGGGVAWLGEWLAGTIADCRLPIADCGMRIADCRLQIAETQHAPRTTQHAPRILRCLPAILFALALLWQQPRLWDALHQTHSFQPGHTTAATMLRVLGAPADAVVLSRYPAVAFHAGTAWAPTPAAAWEDVLTYARKRQARYLVVDEWETRLRPALRPLLDPSQAPPELRYLTTVDESAGPVVIYEFVGKGS
jgi:hypothetical protein